MPTKINLKRLENSLDSLAIGIEILKKSIGYYVYYNKPNEHIKTYKIHKSSCGNCAWGTGKIPNAIPGLNGVWIGPFNSVAQATSFINENFSPFPGQVDECNCTK
jgi:hypothetical protein